MIKLEVIIKFNTIILDLNGVLFVRSGLYEGAIFNFKIKFPSKFPLKYP